MRQRHLKKVYKVVSERLRRGLPLSKRHLTIVNEEFGRFLDRGYIKEFQPWWYDQFDNWSELNFTKEYNRFFVKWLDELQQISGINMEDWSEYKKTLPDRIKVRKPRKEKPAAPIRRLQRPETFNVRMHSNNGEGKTKEVIGEKAFTFKGYDFFIHHNGRHWVVSDVLVGKKICGCDRYKQAISKAKEIIETHFETYVSQANVSG